MTREAVLQGKVESFDPEVGLGEVRALDGRRYPFHCTEIVDGTREIDPGTNVEFLAAPGHRGTWQALSLKRGSGR
jgi:CspA family cold shock protein